MVKTYSNVVNPMSQTIPKSSPPLWVGFHPSPVIVYSCLWHRVANTTITSLGDDEHLHCPDWPPSHSPQQATHPANSGQPSLKNVGNQAARMYKQQTHGCV